MEISIGEYCQFTLRGKMSLIDQYGKFECLKVFDKKRITVFKLFDFHVEVVRVNPVVATIENLDHKVLFDIHRKATSQAIHKPSSRWKRPRQ